MLFVLHGGTKQRKAYAAAYVLLTRAQVLLTHVLVPYADLTLTNFSTSPQFRLTRSNFYMQESKEWLAKSSSGRWRRGRRGRRWWRSTTSRSSQSTKLTTFFDSTLAECTGIGGEFLFQGLFGQRHAGTLVCLLVCNFSGKFSHISGLRADGFPYARLVIISTAPNFSIHRRCKLRNSGESEGFSYRSARVTKRSDKLTTLTTNQRKLGSNTSVLRTNRILRFEMMNGGRSYNNT